MALGSRFLSVLLLLFLLECGRKPLAEFHGKWTAPHGLQFEPCGTAERWSVTLESTVPVETSMVFVQKGAESLVPAVTDTQQPPPVMFAVVRGETSSVRRSSGNSSRQLAVHDIVELRTFKTGDCP